MATDVGAGMFGWLLVRYRRAAGLSQEELAEQAGLSRRGISDLERGARRAPHPATVRRLVEALHLDRTEREALLVSAHEAMAQDAPTAASDLTPARQVVGLESEELATASVAELLRRYRLNARLTQNALADRAGLSVRAVSALERGTRRFPYPDTLQRLADALSLGAEERAQLETAGARLSWRTQSEPSFPDRAADARLAARHNLPVQLTSFVGRAQETAQIRAELERTRLLTLAGPGGVGKTRLVLQVAEAELGSFPDGVWFVDLAPLTDAALVPHTIANVFNVRDKPEQPLVASLGATLQPLQLLMILDNCEHVLTACVDLVDRLLRACPYLVILTTSREVLGLGGETVWRVPPLRVLRPDVTNGLSWSAESEAAELFVERARAAQPDFALSPWNTSAVVEICERLEGIPLAIELAACRVGVFGLEQLAERLAADVRFLISKDRTAASRQQTLENAIQWSYDLLTPQEQTLFEQLSVFAGGWTLQAMEAVAGGDHDPDLELLVVLERLVDKSLVQVDESVGPAARYRLLEPLRQFARRRLEERPSASATHERHAAYFLSLFEQAEQEFLVRFATPDLLTRLDAEIDNLRAALRWSIVRGDLRRAQLLIGATRTMWVSRSYLTEGRRWLDEVLALDAAGPPKHPAARAKALLALSVVALYQGDLAVAEDSALRSLELFQELRDSVRAVGALRALALAAGARADLASARRFTEEALVPARDAGQLAILASSLNQLAELDLEEGDLVAAQQHAADALKVARAAENAGVICRVLATFGAVEWRLGRADAAGRICEEALRAARESLLQHAVVVSQHLPALITLGRVAVERGDARSWLGDLLLLARDGYRWNLARGLEVVVEVAVSMGKTELALNLAGAAAALRDRMGTPPWPTERARYAAAVTLARQTLNQEAADVAWMQGWTDPIDQTLAVALDFLRELPEASAGGRQAMRMRFASGGSLSTSFDPRPSTPLD